MSRILVWRFGAAIAFAVAAASASATPLSVTRLANPIPDSTRIVSGIRLAAPAGAIRFCRENPAECVGSAESVAKLDEGRWQTLVEINRDINAAIAPRRDAGTDRWTLDTPSGDCDDYAVRKRHALVASGFPAGAVGLAVVRTSTREMHLVTVVRTDRGEFVLDNIEPRVLPWTATNHRFLMVTDSANPRIWLAVAGAAPVESAPFPSIASLRAAREGDDQTL